MRPCPAAFEPASRGAQRALDVGPQRRARLTGDRKNDDPNLGVVGPSYLRTDQPVFVTESRTRARLLRLAGVVVATLALIWLAALVISVTGLGRLPGLDLPGIPTRNGNLDRPVKAATPPAPAASGPIAIRRSGSGALGQRDPEPRQEPIAIMKGPASGSPAVSTPAGA